MSLPSRASGFTLIELMIVVAILAILLGLSVPAYQQYTIRASVSAALLELSRVKTDLAEFHHQHGRFPATALEREFFRITPADGHPVVRHLNIHGVGACNPNAGCARARAEVQLQRQVYRGVNGDANSQLRLEAITLPDGGVEWRCGPRDVQGLKLEWLPASCRHTS